MSNVITIPKESVLAFQLCQLKVNVHNGDVTPVMRPGNGGGFLENSKANTRGLFEIAHVHISCAYGEGFSPNDHQSNAIVF